LAIPTWTVGQVLTASDVNTWFVPLYAQKTANTSRASSTTLTADPHLIVAMAASATYDLTCLFDYEADAANDMKFQFTLPAGGTMNYNYCGWGTTDLFTNNAGNGSGTVPTIGGGGAGVARGVTIMGNIVTSSAGNLGVNWAQNSSGGVATIWHTSSYMKLVRVG
jgi:hypothetical protein